MDMFEATFLGEQRFTRCHSIDICMYTFFSPLACTISLSQLVRNVPHSSSVLASFARICLLSSTWRFFADADADDDGFPVRSFLRVRTFQLLPRPSADFSNRRSVRQLKYHKRSVEHFRFDATYSLCVSTMYHDCGFFFPFPLFMLSLCSVQTSRLLIAT